jgi:hypothetical protein
MMNFFERRNMYKRLFGIALMSMFAVLLAGAAKHDFQTGKLMNIATDERLYEGTTIRWAVFTVKIAGVVYTARGERVRRHSGDPGQGLIVGDAIQVAIDGENLILLKPEGKELKVKITRRERAQ